MAEIEELQAKLKDLQKRQQVALDAAREAREARAVLLSRIDSVAESVTYSDDDSAFVRAVELSNRVGKLELRARLAERAASHFEPEIRQLKSDLARLQSGAEREEEEAARDRHRSEYAVVGAAWELIGAQTAHFWPGVMTAAERTAFVSDLKERAIMRGKAAALKLQDEEGVPAIGDDRIAALVETEIARAEHLAAGRRVPQLGRERVKRRFG